MLYAQKGNRVIDIDNSQKERYSNDGYTIYEDGKIVEYPKGATVHMKDFQKLKEENEKLKKENEKLKKQLTEITKEKEPKKSKEDKE